MVEQRDKWTPEPASALQTELAALRRANALAVAALSYLREGALARRDEYTVTEIDYVLRDMHAAASADADAERTGDGGAT